MNRRERASQDLHNGENCFWIISDAQTGANKIYKTTTVVKTGFYMLPDKQNWPSRALQNLYSRKTRVLDLSWHSNWHEQALLDLNSGEKCFQCREKCFENLSRSSNRCVGTSLKLEQACTSFPALSQWWKLPSESFMTQKLTRTSCTGAPQWWKGSLYHSWHPKWIWILSDNGL